MKVDADIEITSFRIKGTRVHAVGPGRHGAPLDSWRVYSPLSADGQHARVEQAPDLGAAIALARKRGFEDAPAYVAEQQAWGQPVEAYVVPPPDEKDLPLCLCPATSEYDPPCPRHGVLGIGVRGGP